MRSSISRSSKTTRTLTTGKVLNPQLRKSIRALVSAKTPASITAKRLQTILTSFRARAKKLAKSSNSKTRH